ncbi:hypothetical protein EVAR_99870_1 [Eumeta japonica]|uniref:Uncharacterized protein n=1 Tax=Eumeta variegata TaxID=151549 RepID=A0A4C1ZJQ2_EUMVA|nr:hypothetical protein EVAR_99870_1 [Eumeta japonica]
MEKERISIHTAMERYLAHTVFGTRLRLAHLTVNPLAGARYRTSEYIGPLISHIVSRTCSPRRPTPKGYCEHFA